MNSESESTDTLSTTEETKENFIDKLTQKVLPNLEAKKLSIKGMWNKTIHKKTDVNQEIFEKLDGKVKKIRKKFSEIDVFVKNIGNNETNYGNELMRVINGWHELEDLGLADRWKEVSHGLEMLNESIEKYITESDEARSELRTFELKINDFVDILSLAKLNPDLIENTHIKLRELKDIRDTMVETCKGKLIKSMATRLQDSLKYVSSVINFMDDTEEVDIIGNFSSLAKIHRYQCPFYIYEVESSNDPSYTTPETIKIGSPETAY